MRPLKGKRLTTFCASLVLLQLGYLFAQRACGLLLVALGAYWFSQNY